MLFEFYEKINRKLLILQIIAISFMIVFIGIEIIMENNELVVNIANHLFWLFLGFDFGLLISIILIKRVIKELLSE